MTGTLTPEIPAGRPAHHRRAQLPLAPDGRDRQVPDATRRWPGHRGLGRGDRHRRGAAGGSGSDQGGGRAPSPDPERYFLLANTAGCYTADEAVRYARLGPRGGLQRVREARGHRRPRDAAARHRRPARGAARTLVARGLPGPRLHQRRPDHRAPARGGRLRGGHAARLADRQRAGPAQSLQHPHIKRRLSVR